jgi:signal transduction histidine kinase
MGLGGVWHLQSWDARETRHRLEAWPVAAGGVAALGLLLLGWRVAGKQARALREAASRVSFVNQVSHELGAPLTNLWLNLELATELLPPDATAPRTRLGLAQEETLRLTRLVDNVLSLARQEKGDWKPSRSLASPRDTVEQVLETFRPSLERHGVVLEALFSPETAESIFTDHAALAQITVNLLSNVEKYAARGGHARLSLPRSENMLSLTLADCGPGIPAADREKIFRPFHRLQSNLTEGSSGAGLGLAIARDFAEKLGGTLRVVPSEPKTGALFELLLPV